MIYFAQVAANQNDLAAREAERAGASNVRTTSAGVQFSGTLEVGYRFTMTTRIASRVLVALFYDEDIDSADKLYESACGLPWEEHLSLSDTFQITQTVQSCNWLKNSYFASLKLKDAIVDRMKSVHDGMRPDISKENPDVTFHLHIRGTKAIIYADFSGEGLYKRGYRSGEVDAVLKEHLASAVLYRSEWYRTVLDNKPSVLLDPFCGVGTIPVEAALIAHHIAPGLIRKQPYAFEKLKNFDKDLYNKVLDELGDEAEKERDNGFRIYAGDISRMNVEKAKAAALKAGVLDYIDFSVKDFTKYTAEDIPEGDGYIVTDPPYGVRLNDTDCTALYEKSGQILQNVFKGWHVAILCADSQLLSYIDMKPERTNALYNGGLLCQLAHYIVFTDEQKAAIIEKARKRKEERLSTPLSPGAQMAYNRLVKNLSSLKKEMADEGVTCYRIYDADMPEYSAAIDLYEDTFINLSEYAPPATIDSEDAARRLDELVLATERATGVDPDNIFVKQRKEQKGKDQYRKLAGKNKFYVAHENGVKVLVNFSDYLDTGIFLDHRPIRAWIQEHAEGKRFLNLFCYTATASLNAVKGGAISTTNVDSSATYLDWAMENFKINGWSTDIGNFFYRSDCIQFLWDTFDRYDLIFCDPPTYSNSKSRASFDVQKDHARLIDAAMMHLEKDGVMIFSNNYRRFKMDESILEKYSVEDISEETIGEDFKRDMKIHKCYLIRHKFRIPGEKRMVIKVRENGRKA